MRSVVREKTLVEKIKAWSMNKKGVLGMDTAKDFVLGIMILAVIAFAVIVALASLNDSNALTEGSTEQNQTTNILLNVTGGVNDFFTNAGTWFSLLSVVIIILIISVVIMAVNRFGSGSAGSL